MLNLKRILWATDGSRHSNNALSFVKLFAKRFNAEIYGLHVIRPVDRKIRDIVSRRLDVDRMIKEESSIWSNKFESMKRDFAIENLNFSEAIIEKGIPYEEIISVSTRYKIDLIIMGKRGIGLKERRTIGSNTFKVLQGSRIPVLAVKDRATKGLPVIKKILVPFDINEKVNNSFNYAISLGNLLGAGLKVIYVEKLVAYPYEFPVSVLNDIRSFYERELKSRTNEVLAKENNRISIKHEILESISPFLGIIRFAERDKSDLIVMNTHGRKGLKKLILGSVAERVINESPCSVLAIKP